MDRREAILSRLLEVLRGVEGVLAVGRNVADVPGLTRPAILMHDGREEFFDAPPRQRRSLLQLMALSPVVTINAGADGPNIGTLLNLLRTRVLPAVLTDSPLHDLLGTNGRLHLASCERLQAGPESKEGRLQIDFTFTYVLNLTELSSG